MRRSPNLAGAADAKPRNHLEHTTAKCAKGKGYPFSNESFANIGYDRCIPKMDHHCPWTMNCVSHITFPHFIRFVSYAVAAMSYLEYFLYVRVSIVWSERDYPSVCAHLVVLAEFS
jgi:hypothetical protein